MKSRVKTALGIDIGETRISAALLKGGAKGVSLVEASHIALPEGTIEQGRVADPAALLAALKTLRTRHGVRTQNVALSVPAQGALARVVPLEVADPQEIGAFVAGEVRQYAAFSGRETVSDYRVLTPATQRARGRIFIAAADRQAVTTLVGLCRREGIHVTTVEPVTSVCARVLARTKTQGRVVLALRRDGMLSLCALQGGILDFIRSKACGSQDGDIDAWVAEEIQGVIEFYRSQCKDNAESWQVLVVDDDCTDIVPQARWDAVSRIRGVTIQFCTREAVPLIQPAHNEGDAEPSIAALGLAIRLLEEEDHGACVNLLPPEALRGDRTKRRLLLAANLLAATVPMMVLIAGGLNYMAGWCHREVLAMRCNALGRGDHVLPVAVDELSRVEGQIKVWKTELGCLNSAWESQGTIDWSRLLKDITSAVPGALRITELSQEGSLDIRIEGISKSNEAVDVFVEMLARSDLIERASLLKKGSGRSDEGRVDYTIRCTPIGKEIR